MINQKNAQDTKKTPKDPNQPQDPSSAHQKKDSSSENRDELSEMMKRIKEVRSLNSSITKQNTQGIHSRDRWILNSSQNKQTLIEYLLYTIILPFCFSDGSDKKKFYYQCINYFCYFETDRKGYSSPINSKSLFVRENDEKEIKRFKKVLYKKMRENDKRKSTSEIYKEN